MNRDGFWLTDEQFAKIKPHLPTDTRGKPRVDDRRVISGIIHVLKSGGRWVDAPRLYGPHKTLYKPLRPLGCQGRLGRSLPCARERRRATSAGAHRQFGGEGASLSLGR